MRTAAEESETVERARRTDARRRTQRPGGRPVKSAASVVAKDPAARVAPTVFRASDLQRQYRTVLDQAKSSTTLILDSDNSVLAIEPWRDLRRVQILASLLVDVARFTAAQDSHHDEADAGWTKMTAYPWLASLPRERVEEFSEGLLPYLLEAVRRQDLDGFVGYLQSWHAASELWSDESLARRLSESLDDEEFEEIQLPAQNAIAEPV
jgi:hypothetical protein